MILKGVVIWRNHDEILLSHDSKKTLQNFQDWRKNRKIISHDVAFLFTHIAFDGSVVGKALVQTMCSGAGSGGVVSYHSDRIDIVATTLAHEMGHNFGMDHDSEECVCPGSSYKGCIMSPTSETFVPTQWSSCSKDKLRQALSEGIDFCLRNKPETIFDSPTCGNGFLEAGEECDCGLPENCDNRCCDPLTCKLIGNAVCATGSCCDLNTCKPSSAGIMCRIAIGECDLSEYCTGRNEFCPEDVFRRDTEQCEYSSGHCLQGTCRSHDNQCRMLWGSSAASFDLCYNHNLRGDKNGNCGYNHFTKKYTSCNKADFKCGRLQCRATVEIEYRDPVFRRLDSPLTAKIHSGSLGICHTAAYPELIPEDPGLVPDGAKCGRGEMCYSQKCVSVESVRKENNVVDCPSCNGHGVCSSKGLCHCDYGFAPPFCNETGSGGSSDVFSNYDNAEDDFNVTDFDSEKSINISENNFSLSKYNFIFILDKLDVRLFLFISILVILIIVGFVVLCFFFKKYRYNCLKKSTE